MISLITDFYFTLNIVLLKKFERHAFALLHFWEISIPCIANTGLINEFKPRLIITGQQNISANN